MCLLDGGAGARTVDVAVADCNSSCVGDGSRGNGRNSSGDNCDSGDCGIDGCSDARKVASEKTTKHL